MRKVALPIALLVLTAVATAGAAEFDIDKAHSSVDFKVKHMMVSYVRGQFTDFTGSFIWDAADPTAGKVNATIQAASVNTGNEKRDGHLTGPDFFDVANFPTITFVSTKVEPKGKDHYALHGDLTMRGVTKPVVLDLEFLGEMADPKAGARAGWEATGTIKRSDFGVSWSKTLDNGGVVVSDEVSIELAVEGLRKD